jgi:hypothetical protein
MSNGTLPYCWVIHILSFIIVSVCLALGVGARLLREKRRIEFSHKLEKYCLIALIAANGIILFIYILGNLYITNIKNAIQLCNS